MRLGCRANPVDLPPEAAIAATLRAGPEAALTGPAVLALYDVDGGSRKEAFVVLVPEGRRLRQASFVWHADPAPDRAHGNRGEVRIAGPLDALIESAAHAPEVELRKLRLAHDVLRWRGLLREGQLL